MNEIDIIENLILFGLTRQEATIYICLCKGSDLTGYEVAKQTGISRSNVYTGLAGLVEKGAAYILEGTSTKYRGVPVDEFCNNRVRFLSEVKEFLLQNMNAKSEETEGYVTISGYRHILDKIHYMLENAEQRVYVSLPKELIELLRKDFSSCLNRGIKIVIISSEDPDLTGANVYLKKKKDNQLRIIVDSKYVLTGDITGSTGDSCLYCAQQNFVHVFKDALRNEIKLIELTKGELYE